MYSACGVVPDESGCCFALMGGRRRKSKAKRKIWEKWEAQWDKSWWEKKRRTKRGHEWKDVLLCWVRIGACTNYNVTLGVFGSPHTHTHTCACVFVHISVEHSGSESPPRQNCTKVKESVSTITLKHVRIYVAWMWNISWTHWKEATITPDLWMSEFTPDKIFICNCRENVQPLFLRTLRNIWVKRRFWIWINPPIC